MHRKFDLAGASFSFESPKGLYRIAQGIALGKKSY